MLRYHLSAAFAVALATPASAESSVAADASDASSGAEITVIATRVPAEAEDVPATVTIIDTEQIADELMTDIKELVRFEPGVSVRRQPARFGAALGSTGRDGNSAFNIRGLEGNRVLMLVDGVRIPDGFAFGAQAAGRGDYVDLGLLKSVEILRGAASALYGSDGLAGAVSFVTADPEDLLREGKSVGGRVSASYSGADEQFSETAVLAGRSGDLSAMVAYTRRDGHELETQGTNDGTGSSRTTANPQDTKNNAVLAKLVWQPGDASRLRLTFDHGDGRVETDVLSGRSATVLDLFADDETKRNRVTLDWAYRPGGAIDEVQVAAYWQDAKSEQFTFEDRSPAVDRTRRNIFENRVFGANAEARSDFATGSLNHRLVYGADISETRQKGMRDGTVPTPPDVFPTRPFPATDYLLAGAFLSDEISIGETFTLFPAVRFDTYKLNAKDDPLLPGFEAADQDGSRLSPKIGAVWNVGDGFSLFANYAHGFKAPEPGQVNQFFENPTSPFFAYRSIPNPDLKPETSKSFEGGVRFAGNGLSAGVTGFTGRYRNFISQQQVGGTGTIADPILFQFVNLSRVKIRGVEGRLEGQLGAGFEGRFAIAYAKGDVTDEAGVRTPLQSIDPVKLVAGLGWRDPDDRFGGQLILTHSARKSSDRAGSCSGTTCYRPDGFTILDATAFARIGRALTVRAGIFNLLDEKYAWWSDVRGLTEASAAIAADAYTQPGRNISVSLTASF